MVQRISRALEELTLAKQELYDKAPTRQLDSAIRDLTRYKRDFLSGDLPSVSAELSQYPDIVLGLLFSLSPSYYYRKSIPLDYEPAILFALGYGLIESIERNNQSGSYTLYRLSPHGYSVTLEVLRKRAEMDTRHPQAIPINDVGLSVQPLNTLRRARITNVSEVLEMTDQELLKIRNFGKFLLKETRDKTEFYRHSDSTT